jgi:putative hydrolase of the HAD superfamily
MSSITTALFDLDGCLYPAQNGLEEHCRRRIYDFMVLRLGLADAALAEAVWSVAFRRYNQSLRALRALGYTLDADEYWRFIREGSLHLLSPAPDVRALLEHLNAAGVACYVFTNCREREALEALEALNLPPSLFQAVYGADFMGGVCKPELSAFEKVLAATGADPRRTAYFEDSYMNLVTGASMGMKTILVGDYTLLEEGPSAVDVSARVPALTLAHLRASPAAAFLPL